MSSNAGILLTSPKRLDSWKTIAEYLGRSCRTIQRWRERYGLPIRKVGDESGSVFAFTDELDDWFRQRPID